MKKQRNTIIQKYEKVNAINFISFTRRFFYTIKLKIFSVHFKYKSFHLKFLVYLNNHPCCHFLTINISLLVSELVFSITYVYILKNHIWIFLRYLNLFAFIKSNFSFQQICIILYIVIILYQDEVILKYQFFYTYILNNSNFNQNQFYNTILFSLKFLIFIQNFLKYFRKNHFSIKTIFQKFELFNINTKRKKNRFNTRFK